MDSNKKIALFLGLALLAFVFLDSGAAASPYYVVGASDYVREPNEYYIPTVDTYAPYNSSYYYPYSYSGGSYFNPYSYYGSGYIGYPYIGETYWKVDPYRGLYPARPVNAYYGYYPSVALGTAGPGFVFSAYWHSS
jgi:hypothetical protein